MAQYRPGAEPARALLPRAGVSDGRGAGVSAKPGLFLAVEGIEGSGKSTFARALGRRIAAGGRVVVVTREPGGTPLGEGVRALFVDPKLAIGPVAEAMLLSAARAQHLSEVIGPAVERGDVVISDRFALSTLAYQGFGRGVDLEALRALSAIATSGAMPARTFLLDLPAEAALERMQRRNAEGGHAGDRIERETLDFHRRVREGYRALARADRSVVVLDATRDAETLVGEALASLGDLLR